MNNETTPKPASILPRFAKALAAMSSPKANKINPAFRSKYCTLDVILDHVRTILAKHDLAIYQSPVSLADGRMVIHTYIVGPEGEYSLGSIPVNAKPESTPQALGSAITYARRQAVQACLGIATDADDDGAAGSTIPTTKKWEPKANG
jgi:hypothetical protein